MKYYEFRIITRNDDTFAGVVKAHHVMDAFDKAMKLYRIKLEDVLSSEVTSR